MNAWNSGQLGSPSASAVCPDKLARKVQERESDLLNFTRDHVGLGTNLCASGNFPDLVYEDCVHDIIGNLEPPPIYCVSRVIVDTRASFLPPRFAMALSMSFPLSS